jgi:hypothetical protein
MKSTNSALGQGFFTWGAITGGKKVEYFHHKKQMTSIHVKKGTEVK